LGCLLLLLLLLLLLTSMKTAVAPHCAMCAATPSGTHSIRMLILLPRSISLTVRKKQQQQQQQQSEEHGIKARDAHTTQAHAALSCKNSKQHQW
jgi:hypothetical protein